MRVAGQVGKIFELSENGKADVRAQGTFRSGKVAILSWRSNLRNGSGEKERGLIML